MKKLILQKLITKGKKSINFECGKICDDRPAIFFLPFIITGTHYSLRGIWKLVQNMKKKKNLNAKLEASYFSRKLKSIMRGKIELGMEPENQPSYYYITTIISFCNTHLFLILIPSSSPLQLIEERVAL